MKKLIVLSLCVFVTLSIVNAEPQELIELQRILAATRGTWVASETYVSRMTVEQQQRLLGLLPGVYNPKELKIAADVEYAPRDVRYQVAHTPIRDQRSCGSCYAFGACASYESWKLVKGVTTDLSEQDFMMKAKSIGPYGGCRGWYLDTSMNLLKNNGVCDESSCPYKGYESACSNCQPTHKIGGWASTTNLNTIKSKLTTGAVYVGFAVYSDFMSYSGGVYRYTSGSLRGYHAVAIVGYDDSLKCFKVKNSWGTGWGESGYFRIGYDQMTNAVKFGNCFGGSFYITR